MIKNDTEYAGFWLRFAAMIVDVVLMMVVLFIPLSLIYGMDYWQSDRVIHGFWDVVLSYVVPILATIWFWRRFLGTPGKMLLKLEIVDADSGQAMSRRQAIIRYFAYLVSTIPLFLGFIWILFDRRKQGWHDKLAGSVVVRRRAQDSVPIE